MVVPTSGTQDQPSSPLLVCPSTALGSTPTPPVWIGDTPLCHTGTRELSEDPDTQAGQVISIMNDYAIKDAPSPPIVGDAARIITGAQNPDDPYELAAGVWRYVHDRVRFTRDQDIAQPFVDGYPALKWNPVAEALIRPREMSKLCTWDEDRCQRIGDCDDFSMWCASILYCIGIPCAFVTVAGDPDDPGRYSHVYVAARCAQGSRTAIDASHGHHAGDEVPNRFGKLKEWPVRKRSNFAALLPFVIAAGLLYLGWRYSAL